MGGLCGQSRSGGAMGGMRGGMSGMGRNSAGGFGYAPNMAGGVRSSQAMGGPSTDRNSPFFQTQSGLPQYQRNLLAAGMGFQGAFDPNSYAPDASGSSAWNQFLDTPEEQSQWRSITQSALGNQSMFSPLSQPQMQRSQYAPMDNGGGFGNDALSAILGKLMQPQTQQPTQQNPNSLAMGGQGSFGAGGGMGGLLGQLLGIGGGSGMPYNTKTGSGQNPLGQISRPYDYGRSLVNSAGQYPPGQEWRAMT